MSVTIRSVRSAKMLTILSLAMIVGGPVLFSGLGAPLLQILPAPIIALFSAYSAWGTDSRTAKVTSCIVVVATTLLAAYLIAGLHVVGVSTAYTS